jgi:hypothetical protein
MLCDTRKNQAQLRTLEIKEPLVIIEAKVSFREGPLLN